MEKAWIITSPEVKYSENAIYYFKKNFTLDKVENTVINITAEARYKLFINGKTVSFGPYKGTAHHRFYNTVDITDFLRCGENEIRVQVLQLAAGEDVTQDKYLISVPRTGNMALLIWGMEEINTNSSWECAKDVNIRFIKPKYGRFASLPEEYVWGGELNWINAREVEEYKEEIYYGEIKMWHLKSHNLPPQKYDVQKLERKDAAGNYDFGRIVTGFIRIKAKGTGRIKLTYSECYVFTEDGREIKRRREDHRGELLGDYDIIEVNGEREYETFWIRSFRYIKVEGEGEISEIYVAETGYPLNIKDGYDFGNDTDNKLWEISINTLKCCMHETYEDCPYYEQLQYAMDTYIQMIFTMKLTDDISLVKRGIHDFAASLSAGEIAQARYPSVIPAYITGFSLYFIYMLDALEQNRGEHEFIKKYLGTVDSIISAFTATERADGLLGKNEYWNFIDWVDGWQKDYGVPVTKQGEALTVYNMMYICALKKAARLCRIFGRYGISAEYEQKAENTKKLVQEKCYCEKTGLYADTDEKRSFSQHAQVWAVLSETEDAQTGKRLMKATTALEAKGGFAYAYHILRAFEKADEYGLAEDMINKYRGLVELGCTTIPETPENPRSECHAWGAVLIYEFTSMVLGVKEAENEILIQPYISGRNRAKGTVYTRWGAVDVSWEKDNDRFYIEAKADKDVKLRIKMPDGMEYEGGGEIKKECILR